MKKKRQRNGALQCVYILDHINQLPTGGEDTKRIGMYSSQEEAEAGRERVRYEPGFIDAQDGFVIQRYNLNEGHWVDGFEEAIALKPTQEEIEEEGRLLLKEVLKKCEELDSAKKTQSSNFKDQENQIYKTALNIIENKLEGKEGCSFSYDVPVEENGLEPRDRSTLLIRIFEKS